MTILALLILPTCSFAAPVPVRPQQPGVEVVLSAASPRVLVITIRNNGKQALELPYFDSPLERFVIDIRGEKGGRAQVTRTEEDRPLRVKPQILTIPAGKSETLTVHTCHSLPEAGRPGETFTFTATLDHNGKTVRSRPLTVVDRGGDGPGPALPPGK